MMKKMLDQEEDEEDHEAEWSPDFHWLTDCLAIGGCFPGERSDQLAREHGIGAVVDLRDEDRDDEPALRAAGIDFLHLPTPDMESANADMLERGVRFVQAHIERGDKVLIHCRHGIGRSALLSLCVLVEQGWEPVDALAHAKDVRAVISPSRSQYDGWSRWLFSRGKPVLDYHQFGCIAYRHLAND